MSETFANSQRFERVPHVERSLARGRRLVQPLVADTPTQLAGSAPMIWDLLDAHPSVEAIVPELQSRFTDSPDVIAGGVRAAISMFIDSSLVTSPDDVANVEEA